MRPQIPTLFGRATAILNEHENMYVSVARLRSACSKLCDETLAETQRLVQEFAAELRVHFAAEEADSYFGTLLGELPALRIHIEHLVAEHAELLSVADELSHARTTPQDLALRVDDLVERFKTHERAENAMLQKFFAADDVTS
jgi:hypothetical protein